MAWLKFNLQATRKRHKYSVNCVYELPNYFVSIGGYRDYLIFWDKDGQYVRRRSYFSKESLVASDLASGKTYLALSFSQSGVRLIDTLTTNLTKTKVYHDPSIDRPNALHFTPDAQHLLIVCPYRVIVYNLLNHQIEQQLDTHARRQRIVACNNELAFVHITHPNPVLYGKDNTDEVLEVWSLRTGKIIWKLDNEVTAACFLPDGETILLATGGTLVICNLATGEILQQLISSKLYRNAGFYFTHFVFKRMILMMSNSHILCIARRAIYIVPLANPQQIICVYDTLSDIVDVHRINDHYFMIVDADGQVSLRALPFNHLVTKIQLEGALTASVYSHTNHQLVVGTKNGFVHFVELAGIQKILDQKPNGKFSSKILRQFPIDKE